MDALLSFSDYFSGNWMALLEMTYEHIVMVLLGILFALIVGVPLGVLCTKNKKFEAVIMALANMIQVIPSLALLAVLMLIFGLGFKTVVIGLFLYSLLPIIRNTAVGLKEVDKNSIEAGTGMGMTRLQLLLRVKFPLSLPFVLAGLRIALVIGIGVATLAPFIGGDGLGREILSGINVRDTEKIFGGAIFAAILAILVDYLLGQTQKRIEAKR
ncbi:MAG TPA: ABC transporter permease [Lentibacillus sp.]|uniref:ABC transporter permease n=1 Tax=Lentibacillus sp. TaxID=1925746 RepID=UPI002B4B36AD|nr:ABC transporter permease [Lentibacillus sp.]HLR62389.1 ABC transporter permease [Lentibacillus sp.]